MPEFRFFVLTMAENFSTMILTSSYKIMTSYINAHALTLPNRMVWLKERTDTYWKSFVPLSLVPIWLNERIDTYWKWFMPLSLVPICLGPFGEKPSSLQHTLSIGFPLVSSISKPPFKHSTTISKYLIPKTWNPGSLAVWSSSTYMITNEANWIPEPKSVFSLAMHLIRKDTGVIILLVRRLHRCVSGT